MPRRVAQIIGQVCRYARQMQYTKENLCADLVSVLQPVPPAKNRATLTDPAEVGELLRRIDASRFRFSPGMACALWLVPYTFLRSQEIRGARWEEISFPSGSKAGFITAEGLRKTLIQIGYGREDVCIHGLWATASKLLNECGKYRPDVVERQLAHIEKNAVRAPYNHARYLEERRQMMQDWADIWTDCASLERLSFEGRSTFSNLKLYPQYPQK